MTLNGGEVQQIARNFRDKWIPLSIKRVEPSERDVVPDLQRPFCVQSHSSLFKRYLDLESRDSDAIVYVSEPIEQPIVSLLDQHGDTSSLLTDNNSNSGTRTRKRKSRWDQPSDDKVSVEQTMWSIQDQAREPRSKLEKTSFTYFKLSYTTEVMRHSFESRTKEDCHVRVSGGKSLVWDSTDEEVAPDFGSSLKNHFSCETIKKNDKFN